MTTVCHVVTVDVLNSADVSHDQCSLTSRAFYLLSKLNLKRICYTTSCFIQFMPWFSCGHFVFVLYPPNTVRFTYQKASFALIHDLAVYNCHVTSLSKSSSILGRRNNLKISPISYRSDVSLNNLSRQ